MNNIGVMEIVQGFADLVYYVPAMLLLQDVALPYQCVQVHVHVLEYEIDIDVIVCFHYALQFYDIRVRQLSQEHYLTVNALGVGGVGECIEVFLKSFQAFCFAILNLPYMPVRATSDLF